ncbi:hypothetical protein [Streptomyces sp. GC420]|uniref:Rv1733c family protein n=1 Tax=Streptomyces sp. GC420 TaxID=2697568 RepID=UPI00141508C7|nr:hypothetical protein [Streptomyces sp. GC420]NBM19629.1 hypothetical protein [Streptomyces sp. GC420]
MRTKARFWRWRKNPLRRRSDAAEAWAVLATGVLLATAAPAAGVVTGLQVEENALRQGSDLRQTTAVLTEDAPEFAYTEGGRVRAEARWTVPDGTTRTGRALVQAATDAGAKVTVWLDEDAQLHDPPATPAQATVQGVAFGSIGALGAATLVLGSGWVVRVFLDRHREAEWGREWAVVGPRWEQHRST